jgi:predicted RNA-binding Zn-ribbon protein involved in translation (DUF1610 family)
LLVLRRYDKIQKRRVGMAENYCSNCGVNISKLKESERFCPSCGVVVERAEKNKLKQLHKTFKFKTLIDQKKDHLINGQHS